MGLLALGTPLPWSEAKQHADYVREHGIEQLLHIWHNLKDRTGDRLLWGDEVSPPHFSWTWTGSDRKTRSEGSRAQRGGKRGVLGDRMRLCGQYDHGSARISAGPDREGGGGRARTGKKREGDFGRS